jgi:hypothetical protein
LITFDIQKNVADQLMKIQINIILVILLLFLNGILKAQKTVSDTLAYAKKFETNKEKYIGKPFSLLLKDMTQMQPKKAKSDLRDNPSNPLPSTLFRFSDKDINSANEVTLVITWKADDTPTTPIEFFEQEHNYRFTVNEKNFFEKKIVKDILVYK